MDDGNYTDDPREEGCLYTQEECHKAFAAMSWEDEKVRYDTKGKKWIPGNKPLGCGSEFAAERNSYQSGCNGYFPRKRWAPCNQGVYWYGTKRTVQQLTTGLTGRDLSQDIVRLICRTKYHEASKCKPKVNPILTKFLISAS